MSKLKVHETTRELGSQARELLQELAQTQRSVQEYLQDVRRLEGQFNEMQQAAAQASAVVDAPIPSDGPAGQEPVNAPGPETRPETEAVRMEQPALSEPSAALQAAAPDHGPDAAREKRVAEAPAKPEAVKPAKHPARSEEAKQNKRAAAAKASDGDAAKPAQAQERVRTVGVKAVSTRSPGIPDTRPLFGPRPAPRQPIGQRPAFAASQQGDRQGARPRPQGDRPPLRTATGPGGGRAAAPQGEARFGYPQGEGGRPDRPARPQDRPARPAGAQGMARGPKRGASGTFGVELTPTVEKEKVSNYDPNKKAYERPPEIDKRVKPKKSMLQKPAPSAGLDDERMGARGRPRRRAEVRPMQRIEPIRIEHAVITTENITVKDLAEKIGKPAAEIIKKLMILGILSTINQEISFDTAALIASEFKITLEKKLDKTYEDKLVDEDREDDPADLHIRPPVVTVMGHVDHGKTSVLDAVRKTNVTATEAGGITQHIGAYQVSINNRLITFLDTPGHEAFTAMRARGAQVTDIAVLVVAADDGIMPQSVEAINHARAANVPVLVAINKIDKPSANPDRVKQQLTEHGLLSEEWGGETIVVPVSALTGEGIDSLLEMILLVADVQELKANPNRLAKGTIVEAKLDKGRGPVATVLVQNGTLKTGDTVVAGMVYGRIRAMVDDKGNSVVRALPSQPVEVIGFSEVPEAGDVLYAVEDDRLSRQVAEERRDVLKAQQLKNMSKVTLDDLFNQIAEGQIKDLNIVIKADVQGSVEAVKQSLEKISNDQVRVRAIHGGVGAITESDVMLAAASNAIIIGFNVRPTTIVREAAEREKVDIRLYRIIYNAIEDIELAMKGMLAPVFKEVQLGHAEVRTPFRVSGVGTIAGSYVKDGVIRRGALVRLVRDGIVIHEGRISSLKRFKDDAREVASGFECGIGIDNYNDIHQGDILEAYINEEVKE